MAWLLTAIGGFMLGWLSSQRREKSKRMRGYRAIFENSAGIGRKALQEVEDAWLQRERSIRKMHAEMWAQYRTNEIQP